MRAIEEAVKGARAEKLELESVECDDERVRKMGVSPHTVLTLADVKLALLRRIGALGSKGVFSAYVRACRAEFVVAAQGDARKAAVALLDALGYSESNGGYGAAGRCRKSGADVAVAVGDAMYYMLGRSVLYGETEDRVRKKRRGVYYVFNGATYDEMDTREVSWMAEEHVRAVTNLLACRDSERGKAAVRLLMKINETGLVAKAAKQMHAKLKDGELVEREGRMSAREIEREMDSGDYIGMRNGVYDLRVGRFMPTGTVPRSVLVSMRVKYDYVEAKGELSAEEAECRAEIREFYRTLFASDYNDANDASLEWMWRFMGSLLHRPRKRRAPCIFLGTDGGDNGKSVFTNLLHATLGGYSIARMYEERTYDDRRITCTSTMLPRGKGANARRGLPRDYESGNVQAIFHASPFEMVGFAPPRGVVIAPFGSVFVAGLKEADTARRLYPRDPCLFGKIDKWGPVHFAMMLEASGVGVPPTGSAPPPHEGSSSRPMPSA